MRTRYNLALLALLVLAASAVATIWLSPMVTVHDAATTDSSAVRVTIVKMPTLRYGYGWGDSSIANLYIAIDSTKGTQPLLEVLVAPVESLTGNDAWVGTYDSIGGPEDNTGYSYKDSSMNRGYAIKIGTSGDFWGRYLAVKESVPAGYAKTKVSIRAIGVNIKR